MRLDELFTHRLDFPGPEDRDVAAWFRRIPSSGGVYLLTDEQDRQIQLASTGNLRRALQHRLAKKDPAGPSAATDDHQTKAGPDQQDETSGPHPDTGGEPDDGSNEGLDDGAGDGSDDGPENGSTSGSDTPSGPTRSRRADLSAIVRRVYWRDAWSAFEVSYEYYRLARVLMPKHYRRNLAFGPAWFVHVNPQAVAPYFTTGKWLQGSPGVDLGPFATQSEANRFVQVLEDVFDLCRYPQELEKAPQGQACAYYEMGRCPAPCNATIAMSEYRRTLQQALQFALGHREQELERLRGEMKQAADELAFERAAGFRQRMQRAGELDHSHFRLVRPIDRFRWLVIQRGPGRTWVKPFFVDRGQIAPGECVKYKKVDQAVEGWLAFIAQQAEGTKQIEWPVKDDQAENVDPRESLSEQIWQVSHFLFKKDPPGLFLDAAASLPEDEVVRQVHEMFASPDSPDRAAVDFARPDN